MSNNKDIDDNRQSSPQIDHLDRLTDSKEFRDYMDIVGLLERTLNPKGKHNEKEIPQPPSI